MNSRPESASHRLDDYSFEFPEELVAAAPAGERDASRLLVVERRFNRIHHRRFSELGHFLRPGDCLVINRSKVLPARLSGRKTTGGKVELLLVAEEAPGLWRALSSDLKLGATVHLENGAQAQVEGLDDQGEWLLRFSTPDVRRLMEEIGRAPLPLYILKKRQAGRMPLDAPGDLVRYQTVYAKERGSIAAPTAGLHFTESLLAQLRRLGIRIAEILLHVGVGTFRPVNVSDVREHRMLAERYQVPQEAAETISETRLRGGRIVPVGTTSVRTLETWWPDTKRKSGATDLFIRPGHEFRCADALLTNFHQPRSTPLLLASAFAGRQRLLAAYREAVEKKYRLFSYGDSMLIL